jgi:hypothetical protein
VNAKITLSYRTTFGTLSECSIEEEREMTLSDIVEWLQNTALEGVGFSSPKIGDEE